MGEHKVTLESAYAKKTLMKPLDLTLSEQVKTMDIASMYPMRRDL